MRISNLDLYKFRNYDTVSFLPGELNILTGRNAQGKTTILEAIYMLATARSWRAGRENELIKWDEESSRVFGSVHRVNSNDIEIEIELFRNGRKTVKVNTIRQTRLADLMGNLNAVLIEPQDIEIVRSDPSMRRRFLDIEISQIQPQYCNLMAGYKRILEHRNRLLKDIQSGKQARGMLEVLTEQLTEYASQIIERRLIFVKRLREIAGGIHSKITHNVEMLKVSYQSSLELDDNMISADIKPIMTDYLNTRYYDEIKRGVTLAGPHRDDMSFTLNDIDTRVYGSQGQQRTVALSLRLAEIDIMKESAGEAPIALLDDVMTDIDEDRRMNVFDMTGSRCQTFITTANAHLLSDKILSKGSIFLVNDGRISRL